MLTVTLPLHERTHDDAFDFDGPADCPYVDAFDSREEYYAYGKCTCGFRAACRTAEQYGQDAEYPDIKDWPTCSGCDPVMNDCRPSGWGIESFEDPGLADARASMDARVFIGSMYREERRVKWGMSWIYECEESRRAEWIRTRDSYSRRNRKLERTAEKVWNACCQIENTHKAACERYARWANRKTGKNLNIHGKETDRC